MTREEIKAKLDELKIEYNNRSSTDSLKSLLPNEVKQDSDEQETPEVEEQNENSDGVEDETEKPDDLTSKFNKAVKKEVPKEETKDNTIKELKEREYGLLTRGQRLMLRQESEEYKSVDNGVNVVLNDRVATEKRIVQLADKSYVSLFKGKEYSLEASDYDFLKETQIRVKTEATKDKCCGQAQYENIDLLVTVDA